MKTTKELVLERIAKQIDEQTAKGAVKYNKPLEDCDLDDYDWQAMQIEELIDGSRYQYMENMRLKKMLKVKTESNRKLREEIAGLEKRLAVDEICSLCEGRGKTIQYNGSNGITKQTCSKCNGKGAR